ncbi:hypothetical protein [Microbacterium flavum]|uniref:Asl1-like glycosyl hydrolase catalytic domain-containing protein n=1 Tax=Microbacterium flavum TaxID=415216 RepID=A0ABS5XSU0_9MICO|nr:hypothetical protein [Microbacterium flavum]MBT8797595.1 hypothetical protein [Microbacterium flavum]
MRRRTLILTGLGALLVLGGIGVTAAIVLGSSTSPTASPAVSASPSPTPTIVPLPHVAAVEGTIADWQLAPRTAVAEVGPEVGGAADGKVALAIEAPTVDAPLRVAQITVPVVDGAEYRFSARARLLSPERTRVPAAFEVGSTEIAVPALDASWTEITGTVTAAGASELAIALRVDAPVTGLAIDDIVLTETPATSGTPAASGKATDKATDKGEKTANVVPNPSFEDVAFAHRLVNTSLMLRTETAALAVVLTPGAATWTVTRGDGTSPDDPVVDDGSLSSDGSVASIPVSSLGQGYYILHLTDAAGTVTTAPFAIVDGEVSTADDRFGVSVHVENALYDKAARYTRSVGGAEIRNDVLWRRNETVAGQYDWDPVYADGFDKMHQNGIKVLGIVNYGNKLYSRNDKVPDNPEALAAYGRYAAAIVQRFDLVGVEVYNEFNHARFNTSACGTEPACYVPLLEAVHTSVKAVDPAMPVVAGATALYDAPWFDGLWQAGGMAYTDVISYHPYLLNEQQLGEAVDQSVESMRTNAGDVRPVWISELGNPSVPGWNTIAVQASSVLKMYAVTLGHGVQKMFWYDLVNDSDDPAKAMESNAGLFYFPTEGVAALTPKPSGFVYAMMTHALAGRAAQPLADPIAEGTMSYAFGTGAQKTTVAFSTTGGPVQATIASKGPLDVLTLDGKVTTAPSVKGEVSVTIPGDGVIISEHVSTDAG